MKAKTYIYVIFALSVLATGGARAEEALTLERTLSRVYIENPTLQAAREAQKATEESYNQAIAGWRPIVSAEGSVISTDIESGNFSNGDGATTKSGSVSIEQPLFRGFRTTGEIERAKKTIAAGKASLAALEQEVFLRTAGAYMDVIRDRQLLSLQLRNVEILKKEKDSVSARFEAGDLTQTDVKQTQARLASAQAEAAIAHADLQRSEALFEEVIGFMPPDDMVMPDISFPLPATKEELVAMASAQNPDLARAKNEHGAALGDVKVANAAYYPQVTAFASYLKEYDPQPGLFEDSATKTVGVRARVNLYEGGAATSRTREAKFRANQRLIEIREAEMGVKSDLIASWRRYGAYEPEIAARELEINAARFSAEGVREEARIGERTVLDLLEAEQEVLEAEEALIAARRGRILSGYGLAAALGLLTADALNLRKD